MQFPGQGRPPVGIVFDSAMGQRIDDALALALLYGFDGKNEARLVSVSVSRSNLKSAAFCDAVGRFYAGAVSGAFGGAARTLPVGLSDSSKMPDDTPMVSVPLSKRDGEGKPLFANDIQQRNDTAEVPALIRNAFTAQYDQNSIVVLTGPATELARVLDLPGAKALIARKVKFLSVAAGAYPEGPAEFNISSDIAAAKKLFSEWPTPIFAAGQETGEAVLFPASSIEKDFAWSPAHPVVEAYRAYKPMPYDAPTGAMAAALYAVRPQEGYFKLSEPGTIRVLDDGRTRFTPSTDGRHRYLIPDPSQKERIVKVYTEIASAKPVPRQPRFRPPKADEKQKPVEAKPPAKN
jgi:inosine-uridine nucleoside N-ribohydrolase